MSCTPGAEKAHFTREFVRSLRDMNVRPQVTQHTSTVGGSAIDTRTTRHSSYSMSRRTRIQRAFGWLNSVGRLRKVKLRGL